MAIVKQKPQGITKLQDAQMRRSLLATLTGLAEARQAAVSDKTLELYAAQLAEYSLDDVKSAVRTLARRKRAEGETAFPSLGDLLDPLQAMQRRKREAAKRQKDINEFWRDLPDVMAAQGRTEEEILNRFPSFRGTKPRGITQ